MEELKDNWQKAVDNPTHNYPVEEHTGSNKAAAQSNRSLLVPTVGDMVRVDGMVAEQVDRTAGFVKEGVVEVLVEQTEVLVD